MQAGSNIGAVDGPLDRVIHHAAGNDTRRQRPLDGGKQARLHAGQYTAEPNRRSTH